MSIYQKQIESEKLNNDVEAWLTKNQITQLPMGFTKFPDGNIPKERAKVVQPEAEREAKIEAINAEVRKVKEATTKAKAKALELAQKKLNVKPCFQNSVKSLVSSIRKHN